MTAPRWPASSISAVMIVGIVGVLIAGLQPQLLGALALEGRLGAARLGLTATVELLAMGLAAGGTGLLIRPRGLRAIGGGAAILLALANGATPLLPEDGILLARIVAGVAGGVLIWIAIGLIARMASPERWAGIYLLTQTFAQLGVAMLLAKTITGFGAHGGFLVLGCVSLIALPCLPFLPREYPPLATSAGGRRRPPAAGWAALASVLLYLAFIVGLWVYLEPLAARAGVDPGTLALAVPVGLAAQVAGASLAILLVGRVKALWAVLGAAAANLALLAVFANGPVAAFLPATALFGLLWMFVLPFQLQLVIAADPSLRAATLIGGAQLIGSSLGPLLASLTVADGDVGAVPWLGAGCILASIAIVLGLQFRTRRA